MIRRSIAIFNADWLAVDIVDTRKKKKGKKVQNLKALSLAVKFRGVIRPTKFPPIFFRIRPQSQPRATDSVRGKLNTGIALGNERSFKREPELDLLGKSTAESVRTEGSVSSVYLAR